jgi:molybdopterin-guanine dinucleotide biosynthesis protein A
MAGDMPIVDWNIIKKLAALIESGAEAAIPQHSDVVEPLYAFYTQSVMSHVVESASSGRGSLREIFPKLRVAFLKLEPTDLSPGLFVNINTPLEAEQVGYLISNNLR